MVELELQYMRYKNVGDFHNPQTSVLLEIDIIIVQ